MVMPAILMISHKSLYCVLYRFLVKLEAELDERPLCGKVGPREILIIESQEIVPDAQPGVFYHIVAEGDTGAVINFI